MVLIYKNKKELPEFNIPSGCSVFGVINESGERFSGRVAIEGISVMHDRSNGLGGGFTAYGIYPQFYNDYVFHIIYDDSEAKIQTEDEIKRNFHILLKEEIPTRKISKVELPPLMFRYFIKLKEDFLFYIDDDNSNKKIGNNTISNEEDIIVDFVMKINRDAGGAYIISSGKNMGIFKGVGYPEDIGNFFKLDEYKGYIWTCHGRFPTNSVGWWGGAHPIGILDWSVVHNGELSSYGTNKRFVSSFGYDCTLSTDTEVIAYLFDFIVRKQKIDIDIIHWIFSPPLWEEIEKMTGKNKKILKALRISSGSALLNGPFSIIASNSNYIYALNDRIKLRPLVAARKDKYLFISSEEASIVTVCSSPDVIWQPDGGEPVIGRISDIKKDDSTADNNNYDYYNRRISNFEHRGSLVS
jgi:glutamate synthase domain-containing protein 1